MNRMAIAALLLLLGIMLCGFELFKINYISDTVVNNLNLLKELVADENVSEAKALSYDIYEFWGNNTILLAIFIQHDSIENIEQSLALMTSAIEQEDFNNFWAENLKTLVQVNNLKNTEYLNIENIL